MDHIKGQEHTVLAIDPDYPGSDYPDAVTLDRTKILRSNLRALYRSNQGSSLTSGLLGPPLDPMWTVGHPKGHPKAMDKEEEERFHGLLAWNEEAKMSVRCSEGNKGNQQGGKG